MVRTVTLLLSTLTVTGQVLLIAGIVLAVVQKKGGTQLIAYLQRKAVLFLFIITLIAMLGSLFFSEVAHYVPCTLCWYQRILMYPLVFILALDLIRGKRTALPYVALLSALGLAFAVYNYLLQVFPRHSIFCSVGSPDCAVKVFFTFGYISIPLMAATAFAMNLLLVYLTRNHGKA